MSETIQEYASKAASNWFFVQVAKTVSPSTAEKMVSALRWYSVDDARNCRALAKIRRDDPTLFEKLIRKDTEENEMTFAPSDTKETKPGTVKHCDVCDLDFVAIYRYCPMCKQRLEYKVIPLPEDAKCLPEAPREIKEKIINQLKKDLARELDVSPSEIIEEALLADDLGADSLAKVGIIMMAEQAFGIENIPDDLADRVKKVGDLANLVYYLKGNEIEPFLKA